MAEEPVVFPIDALTKLIDEMNPFLDTGGRAYIRIPSTDRERRPTLPMNDRRVRNLLLALFREQHQQIVHWGQIHTAMGLVQGRLLRDHKAPNTDANDPTLQLFLKATDEHEGWAGSAQELLTLLRETKKTQKVVTNKHLLPTNSIALGMWLAMNQLQLLAYGIELYRPTRRSTKRLWAWRRVTEHRDLDDTPETSASLQASHSKPKEDNKNPTNDTNDRCGEDPRNDLEEYLRDAMS